MKVVLCVSFCFAVYEKKHGNFQPKCVFCWIHKICIATCAGKCQCDVVLDLFCGENGIP